jgi:hypothetical protein
MDVRRVLRLVVFTLAVAVSCGYLFAALSVPAQAGGREDAIAYAETYADNHNPCWQYFGPDCTNFISQCYYAGGWDMSYADPEWYMGHSGFFGWSWSSSTSWKVTYDFVRAQEELPGNGTSVRLFPMGVANRWLHVGSAEDGEFVSPAVLGDIIGYELPDIYPPDDPKNLDHLAILVAYHGEDSRCPYRPGWHGCHGHVVDYHTANRKHAIWNLMSKYPLQVTVVPKIFHTFAWGDGNHSCPP